MRTTIDLPSELMHAAKVRAAQHGESLKELFTRAIAHEVGTVAGRVRPAGRVTFPLIGTDSDPRVDITNADIADALEAEDIERYGQ
jgi:plasmid stability protein